MDQVLIITALLKIKLIKTTPTVYNLIQCYSWIYNSVRDFSLKREYSGWCGESGAGTLEIGCSGEFGCKVMLSMFIKFTWLQDHWSIRLLTHWTRFCWFYPFLWLKLYQHLLKLRSSKLGKQQKKKNNWSLNANKQQ